MAEKMKKSSINMAPNGKMPAMSALEAKRKDLANFKTRKKTRNHIFLPQDGIHVPDLLWNLPRNLVCPNRLLKWRFTIAKVIAEEHQWEADE